MSAQNETTSNETLEKGSEESVLASLGINSQLFVWQLINFALVAFVVWYKILKPLTKKLDERKTIIDESLDRAKEIETSYAKSKAEYDAALKQAKQEANGIVSEAKRVADELSNAMKAKTKEDIDGLVKQAKVKIDEERDAVMEGVKLEIANLVVTATEKILREKLDDKKDQKLISDTLKSLE
ncbi:MAG: ATP synthase F0 subunit B [Candidatus Magasanikbacteria bacterium RIFCSPHIGHO2_01_FULL_41_23]|uniref:ATP synthase subunit b n=1 Tax=Candidatus Magasanikbacteria bacterium RIFCSPLOWO2_01_FULL_40_15 TaxID=1798686 RepID=A0A1F6N2T8_9BACT|nr:MAG: ATP synthase F0 subunit B [Candidatus Magasanikbacteria bacterium RIFCSPHIGHO2_01_FULL_41_23]OGH66956.1 MAG: ATP synthase F0 subunit B [Candidatus Magasanikbacteria bacterium RIFCSPHIGHO2_02_FULL_41_35]OGH74937.1 MAG: ATP synthase F0 subunit B [Candidatus Magasanikbacteria bacterium RIFCSPHIGHO2_12_FULL_41_16]OGH78239.1 MAG: ATP synthase F0 subunit B [Candidatus Magasanikbacteria bacterium RIFCSPLOWO2_01_FULL_40_15]